MKRIESNFLSKGTQCAGWLYLPDDVSKPPVVIMAHGLAAERTFRLPAFVERFAEKRMAAFLFDYRNFGDSDGTPRNLVSPARHVQDWEAAIFHVSHLKDINTEKIALWGTSFSGGHVLVAAAKNPQISAVVAQVPFVDGFSTALRFDFKYLSLAIFNSIRDVLSILTRRRPHCVPVVADPGTFALLNTPESKPGYMAIIPAHSTWRNECPARILLTLPFYRPISYARKINSPVLIICAQKDSLISSEDVEKTAQMIKNVELFSLPLGHFEVYIGDAFERVVEIETNFLHQHLCKS